MDHESLGFAEINYSLIAQVFLVNPLDLCSPIISSSPNKKSDFPVAVLGMSHYQSKSCTHGVKTQHAQEFGASLMILYSIDGNYQYEGIVYFF